MTNPAAARQNSFGARTYPIPVFGENAVRDLPAVSQVLKVLAAPGLEVWRQKMLAEQLALRPDLIMLASDPSTRYDAIKQALDSGRGASNTGTAIHRFSEMVDDETLDWSMVPEVAKPWVENYAQAKADYGWELVAKEFTVFNQELGYAGTSDRALKVPGYGCVIADVKTGKEIYADQALQLSFYAHGEGIWIPPAPDELTEYLKAAAQLESDMHNGTNIPEGRRKWSADAVKVAQSHIDEAKWREYAEKGQHLPMPEGLRQDVAFIIHLTDKRCELVPMNLDGTEPVVRGMCQVFWWKNRKDIVGKTLEPTRPSADVVAQVEAIRQEAKPAELQVMGPPPVEPAAPAVLPMPVAEPASAVTRREAMQARISALSSEAKSELVFRWPSGVPTLKQSDSHTDEQLQAIDDELWAVECKFAPPITSQVLEEKTAQVLEAFPGSEAEPF